MKFEHTSGGFTLPGESGQEKLTLELAKKWGADVIRDSDGTQLSDEILDAGYDIYSTICIIRDHNAWAKFTAVLFEHRAGHCCRRAADR